MYGSGTWSGADRRDAVDVFLGRFHGDGGDIALIISVTRRSCGRRSGLVFASKITFTKPPTCRPPALLLSNGKVRPTLTRVFASGASLRDPTEATWLQVHIGETTFGV
jgi:hypothetical protein